MGLLQSTLYFCIHFLMRLGVWTALSSFWLIKRTAMSCYHSLHSFCCSDAWWKYLKLNRTVFLARVLFPHSLVDTYLLILAYSSLQCVGHSCVQSRIHCLQWNLSITMFYGFPDADISFLILKSNQTKRYAAPLWWHVPKGSLHINEIIIIGIYFLLLIWNM